MSPIRVSLYPNASPLRRLPESDPSQGYGSDCAIYGLELTSCFGDAMGRCSNDLAWIEAILNLEVGFVVLALS